MDFTSHDIAVIEQALQIAIRSQAAGRQTQPFQEVLSKLSNNAAEAMQAYAEQPVVRDAALDGFRYDYDDSSDLL